MNTTVFKSIFILTIVYLILLVIMLSQKCEKYEQNPTFSILTSSSYESGLRPRSLEENEVIDNLTTERAQVHKKSLRYPDAIVIGEMKCGTSAMRFFLRHHPDIAMAEREVNYFSINYKRGWIWYKTQLVPALPSQIVMEKSVYFGSEENEEAWRRIYEYKPDIKLILNLRDPVDRIFSHYNMKSRQWPVFRQNSLENFIFRKDNPNVINSTHWFVYRGHYFTNMLRWIKYFPLRQIHIVEAETFRKNPLNELIKVEQYLGLRSFFTDEIFYYDDKEGFYCLKLEASVECMPAWATSTKKRDYSDTLIKQLRDYYKPEVDKFYQLVGQNFNWTLGL